MRRSASTRGGQIENLPRPATKKLSEPPQQACPRSAHKHSPPPAPRAAGPLLDGTQHSHAATCTAHPTYHQYHGALAPCIHISQPSGPRGCPSDSEGQGVHAHVHPQHRPPYRAAYVQSNVSRSELSILQSTPRRAPGPGPWAVAFCAMHDLLVLPAKIWHVSTCNPKSTVNAALTTSWHMLASLYSGIAM